MLVLHEEIHHIAPLAGAEALIDALGRRNIERRVPLVGERAEGEPKAMMAAYVETANELADMTALDFFGRYGETARVLKHLNGSPDTTALQIYELHRRHAKYITKVVDDAIAQNRSAIRKRQLPPSGLLRLVCDSSGAQAGLENSDPIAVCELVDNYICITGQCWAIRYDGNEEKFYTLDIGFYHLQILLERPGATFSASELDVMVRRMTKNDLCVSVSAGETPFEEGPSVLGQTDAGSVIDENAVRSYLTRLKEIKEELGEARTNNDLGKIDALESQKEWIELELSNARGLGGKIRNWWAEGAAASTSTGRIFIRTAFRAGSFPWRRAWHWLRRHRVAAASSPPSWATALSVKGWST